MFLLSKEEIVFPNPEFYEPEEGLLAVGGDLSVERVLLAYKNGIFPFYNEGEEILWWCPNPRFVLFPQDLKVSKSMKKILDRNEFHVTYNQNFEGVIRECKKMKRENQDGTWISDDLEKVFIELHHLGHAKSVEVWQENELVGGLYGLQTGKVFCGESMFSKKSNASKAGFITLVQENDFELIDCQLHTTHLESLGAQMIPKIEFLNILKNNT